MEDNSTVVATYMFRGIEYVVTMNMVKGNSLVVEVEDRLTADQWRGTFDTTYIEDLTHKTGNFKQFTIFVNMLESALTQNSDSVSLDLLTYADLESLRNRKAGAGTKTIPGARTAALNSRRYLILTYTVEFDRIHYPLPLPYMGKPDPRALQETIRQLRQEIKTNMTKGNKDFRQKEIEKMRKDYDKLLGEKAETDAALVEYKREMQNTSRGAAVKEVRMLKQIIKNLEEELLQEKMKRQRGSSKRSHEIRQLMEEGEELRASERNLKVRVKNLTNELALYRRNNMKKISTSSTHKENLSRKSYRSDAASSRENSFNRDTSRLSGTSSKRSFNGDKDWSRTLNGSRSKARSNSRERPPSPWDISTNRSRERSLSREKQWSKERPSSRDRPSRRERSLSWDRSRPRVRTNSRGGVSDRDSSCERMHDRSVSFRARSRTPSPSPAGARNPRFDPTAFVKEKERLMKEADLKKKRNAHSRKSNNSMEKQRPSSAWTNGYSRTRNASRGSSVGSLRSRTSSLESLSDIAVASDSSEGRLRRMERVLKPGHTSSSQEWNNPEVPYHKQDRKSKKLLSSTPENRNRTRRVVHSDKENQPADDHNDYFDRSTEISEIDARLNRLQQFMKTNLA